MRTSDDVSPLKLFSGMEAWKERTMLARVCACLCVEFRAFHLELIQQFREAQRWALKSDTPSERAQLKEQARDVKNVPNGPPPPNRLYAV